jgi:hypothetical protein
MPAAATKMPRGRPRLLSLSLNSASSGYPARAAQFLHSTRRMKSKREAAYATQMGTFCAVAQG